MEFFKHEQESECHRHHRLLHCTLHATLQIATLAAVVITLNEVEKVHDAVKHLRRAK